MGRWTRNADVVERLSSDFQERYEFAFAWESACSLYQSLPGLRGFWPISSISTGPTAMDLSGQGRTLTALSGAGAPPAATYRFAHDVLVPYFDAVEASPDWLRRPDEAGLDILGNESYIAAANRGITFGAWVRFDTVAPANADMIASKTQNVLAQHSYALYRRSAGAGGTLRAAFGNGVLIENVDSAAALVANTWYFTAAKWSPAAGSDESACFLNRTKAQVTPTGLVAPANLLNSAASFQLMGRDNGAGGSAENTDGRICLAFLCCQALHDGAIIALYERSRALFGV